jgi:hypothetical protein
MNLDGKAAARKPPYRFGEALAGFAEKLRVEQAVHAPVHHLLLAGDRSSDQTDGESQPTTSTKDVKKGRHHCDLSAAAARSAPLL